MADNMYRLLTGRVEEKDLREVKDLSPTVIIGLGGTGKEVMLRLRKKFFEKYGSLSAFPIVSYIFMDTDTTNKFLTTEAKDIISPQIEFEQDEVIDASIERTSRYTDSLDTYPHIKKWFYPQLKALGDLREGAGQIRPYGRLGFFHRFDVISSKIKKACERVTNPANHKIMLDKYGINVNFNNVNIYIVNSLAGGTGSGIFLDVAFLVKHLQQNARTIGFLILPRIFGDVPRCDANGYAALMELDYYSYGHHFEVEWTPREPLSIPSPPFDYCYLMDGVNETGMTISDKDKSRIFELLSDNIFIDFSMSDFAAFKRGVRINLAQYLQDMFAYVHYTPDGREIMTESFPCRYFSFGLSAISFPLDRVKNACAYKLALDIANHWVKLAKTQRPILALREKVFKEFLPEIGLLEGSLGHIARQDIMDALYKRGEHGETFRRIVNSWAMGVRSEVRNNIPRVEKMGWKEFVRNEIDKHRLLYKEDVDPANCGENIRIMNDNKTGYLNNVKKKLDSKIAEMAGNPFEGVGYCLEILKEMGIIFTTEQFNYIPRFELDQQNLGKRIIALKKKYEDILDE
ncbi:MAG: tubulin-like doman-containing protein, partial [Candidatus Desantisbacteria bacterium]